MPELMTKETEQLIEKYIFTVKDYHLIGETGIIPEGRRVELLNGEIVKMSPIKSPHASTVKVLISILTSRLTEDFILDVQNPVELSEYSEPEPDLAILKFKADFYSSAHPKPEDVELLIEVADSTLQKDRKVKLPLYAEAGIKEVWIVNLKEQQIEVSTEPHQLGYSNLHTYRKGDQIQHAILGIVVVDDILISEIK